MVDSARLEQQLRFICEIDGLKKVERRNKIFDGSRRENSAEHSWHLAMMALILHEYAAHRGIDLMRVLKMILVHDLVEIDAGDSFWYDEEALKDKAEREEAAARRIFGLLPPEQREELWQLWKEFEERTTPEAKFAAALDRCQPMLANYMTGGGAWKEYGVTKEDVLRRNAHVQAGAPALWTYFCSLLDEAVERGYLETVDGKGNA